MPDINKNIEAINAAIEKENDPQRKRLFEDYRAILERAKALNVPVTEADGAFGFGCGGGALLCC